MASRLLVCSDRCPPAMQQRSQWQIKDFALVKEIGSGAVSCVYYALCRKSCLRVAIKVYNKAKLTKLNTRQVEREIIIHSNLSHPHIVDFYAAFEDEHGIYMVLEYAEGGDLFDAVKRSGGRMPEAALVQQVLYPYLCSLMYLHGRGIIHRDIKPENTVFTRELVLKITDFGLAINMRQERPVTRLGTLDYMAPEVLQCPDKYLPSDNKDRADLMYNESVDAWAMGVLAYELIVGRPPFGMADREGTMRAITTMQPFIPDWMSSGAASFITMALDKSPGTRAPIARLIQHPWIAMHTRAKDSLLQQQVSALQHTIHRLGRTNRGLSSGLSNSFTGTRGPPTSSLDASPTFTSSASAAAAAAVAQHQATIGAKGSPLLLLNPSLSSSNGFGSAGSSMTGSGWPTAAPGSPSAASRAAVAGAGAALGGGAGAFQYAMDSDLRPAKRLLQQRNATHLSDAGGGMLPRAAAQPATNAKAQLQAYWCNAGPGWGSTGEQSAAAAGSGAAEGSGQAQPHNPVELVATSDGRAMRRSSSKRRIQEVTYSGPMGDGSSDSIAVDPTTGNSGPLMQLLLEDGSVVSSPTGAGAEAEGASSWQGQQSGGSSPLRAGSGSGSGEPQQQHSPRVYARSSSMQAPHSPPSSPMLGHASHQHQPSRFARAQRPATANPEGVSNGAAAADAGAGGAAGAAGGSNSNDWGLGPAFGNLPALALRSHPLSSPYVTPCSSPMHAAMPAASQPPVARMLDLSQACEPGTGYSLGQGHGFGHGGTQVADCSTLSGLDVAGLSLSSPCAAGLAFNGKPGTKRANGSSSGDSTGGPISAEVLRLMSGSGIDNPFASGNPGILTKGQAQQQGMLQMQGQGKVGGQPYGSGGGAWGMGPGGQNPAQQGSGDASMALLHASQGQMLLGGDSAAACMPQWVPQQASGGLGGHNSVDPGALQLLRGPASRSLSNNARRGGQPQAQGALVLGQQQGGQCGGTGFATASAQAGVVINSLRNQQQQRQQQQQQQQQLERANSATSAMLVPNSLHNPLQRPGSGEAYVNAGPPPMLSMTPGCHVQCDSDLSLLQAMTGGQERTSPVNVDLLLPFLDMDDSPMLSEMTAMQQQGASLTQRMQEHLVAAQDQIHKQHAEAEAEAAVVAEAAAAAKAALAACGLGAGGGGSAHLLSNASVPGALEMDVDELLAVVGCSGSSSPIP